MQNVAAVKADSYDQQVVEQAMQNLRAHLVRQHHRPRVRSIAIIVEMMRNGIGDYRTKP
ncbi:hypothetical protein [Propionispora vibrioides]|jgi:hypothetical protein|uniref:Uncharacterized protein n=1 Tax=Propionispora vibrioides TaxID=112903 RepID=A0A1H8VG46_9FIRM|nr:hypothetical protein [Propionispora vibrioides]SEP14263.1 hypothetical protein SAMN04490178_11169 [Propionispora vibrioides]